MSRRKYQQLKDVVRLICVVDGRWEEAIKNTTQAQSDLSTEWWQVKLLFTGQNGRSPGRGIDLHYVNKKLDTSCFSNLFNARNGIAAVLTIRRVLRNYGIRGRSAAKTIANPPKTSLDWIGWCNQRMAWSVADWKRIVFTDEVSFDCVSSDCRVTVWRRNGKRFDPSCVVSKSRDKRSIMFWGIVASEGRKMLIKCRDRMESDNYVRILRQALRDAITDEVILQQDDFPAHKAEDVNNWLRDNPVLVLHIAQLWTSWRMFGQLRRSCSSEFYYISNMFQSFTNLCLKGCSRLSKAKVLWPISDDEMSFLLVSFTVWLQLFKKIGLSSFWMTYRIFWRILTTKSQIRLN